MLQCRWQHLFYKKFKRKKKLANGGQKKPYSWIKGSKPCQAEEILPVKDSMVLAVQSLPPWIKVMKWLSSQGY